MRKFLLVLLATMAFPAAAHAANCNTAPVWSGSGPTTTVTGSIQSAVDATPAGGTVMVPNGSYSAFSLTKNVRVLAQNQYGATVNGTVRATAGRIDGLAISTSSTGINADGTGDLVVANSRITLSGAGQSFRAFKTSGGKIVLWGNDFRAPNETDYAVQLYGTTGEESCHNYFYGTWHQTQSFKEGNTDGTFAFNTVTGGCCAGVEIGQNGDDNGAGGIDHGSFSVHDNWFGRIKDTNGTVRTLAGPVRIWHVTRANITIDRNVMVGAQSGVEIDCASGSITASDDVHGCPDGTIALHDNVVAGSVTGSTPTVGCLLHAYNSGSGGSLGPLTITSSNLRCWDAPLWSGGQINTFSATGTDLSSGHTQTIPTGPAPRFDPDLSLLGGSPPPPPPGDTTPPTAPTNLTRDARTTATSIWFTWTASTDNVAVDHYREYRDGTLVDGNVALSASSGDWVGGSLAACSDHTVGVEAVDAAGNVSPRTTVTMTTAGCTTADTTPPDTTIVNPPANNSTGSVVWQFTSSEPGSTFQCKWQNYAWAACTSPIGFTGQGQGTYTFQVKATDSAGNVDPTPATATWTSL